MNYAYITLLSNERYLPGVVALQRALEKYGARYPLYCALSKGTPEECEQKLREHGINILRFDGSVVEKDLKTTGHFAHWDFTFDKLKMWELEQFDKLVYIDSDILILGNLDSLFERKPFSGVCAGKSVPGHETWKGINSGVVVIKPDREIARDLRILAAKVIAERKSKGLFVGDQDVLQAYLKGWDDDESLQLDEGYNMFADNIGHYIRKLNYSLEPATDGKRQVYCVHFIGRTKPWMKRSFLSKCWLLKTCLKDIYYYKAYRKYKELLK